MEQDSVKPVTKFEPRSKPHSCVKECLDSKDESIQARDDTSIKTDKPQSVNKIDIKENKPIVLEPNQSSNLESQIGKSESISEESQKNESNIMVEVNSEMNDEVEEGDQEDIKSISSAVASPEGYIIKDDVSISNNTGFTQDCPEVVDSREINMEENKEEVKETQNTQDCSLRGTESQTNIRNEDNKLVGDGDEDCCKEQNMNISSEKKKYTVYEDWKIVEAIDSYIKVNGSRGTISQSLWRSISDSQTGSRLLNGSRSSESMRERYKRWLVYLRPEDKERLKKFASEHTEEEMKNSVCMFKRQENRKVLIRIQTNKKAKKLETPPVKPNLNCNSSSQVFTPRFESIGTNRDSKMFGRGERSGGYDLVREDSIVRCGDGLSFSERLRTTGFDSGSLPSIWEVFEDFSRGSGRSSSRVIERRWVDPDEEDISEKILKKRLFENGPMGERSFGRERSTRYSLGADSVEDYKAIGSQVAPLKRRESVKEDKSGVKKKIMQIYDEMKPQKELRQDYCGDSEEEDYSGMKGKQVDKLDMNLCIYVDLKSRTREFARDEEEEEPVIKLMKMAREYNIQLEEALRIFNTLSGDYEDLELYLRTRDERLIWSLEDDQGLVLNDPTTLRYLKWIKGSERIQKRLKYLLGQS